MENQQKKVWHFHEFDNDDSLRCSWSLGPNNNRRTSREEVLHKITSFMNENGLTPDQVIFSHSFNRKGDAVPWWIMTLWWLGLGNDSELRKEKRCAKWHFREFFATGRACRDVVLNTVSQFLNKHGLTRDQTIITEFIDLTSKDLPLVVIVMWFGDDVIAKR